MKKLGEYLAIVDTIGVAWQLQIQSENHTENLPPFFKFWLRIKDETPREE